MKQKIWYMGKCSSCKVDFGTRHLEDCYFLKAKRLSSADEGVGASLPTELKKKARCPECGTREGHNHPSNCSIAHPKKIPEPKLIVASKIVTSKDVRAHFKSMMGLKRTIWERDRYICYYCRLDMKTSYFNWRRGDIKRKDCFLTVDHIVPQSKGGKWEYRNLVTACRNCNLQKGSKIVSVRLLRAKIAIHNLVDWLFAKMEYIRHY